MEGIVYKYTSPSGKVYIGQTTNEKKRRKDFLTKSTVSYAGYKIDNARKKYGPENFTYEVLIRVNSKDIQKIKDQLNALEIEYIWRYDSIKNGYNSTEGGSGKYGYKMSEESKMKMIEKLKGISPPNKGIPMSNEQKNKLSKAMKGKPSHNKGIPMSDEQKAKISESLKGRKAWNKGIKCESIRNRRINTEIYIGDDGKRHYRKKIE